MTLPLYPMNREGLEDFFAEVFQLEEDGRLPAFGGHRAGTPSGLSRFASQAIRLLIPWRGDRT